MNNFNGLEMIRIALLMEEEGSKFYTECSKHASGKVKELLLTAAGQEVVHGDKFRKMYDDLINNNEIDYSYLFDEETSLYLRALIENRVFDRIERHQAVSGDLKSAFEYAIKAENLTVDVYTKMYSGINNKEVKEVLEQLIKEEKSHVSYFEKLAEEM